jgi:hypothetical protein
MSARRQKDSMVAMATSEIRPPIKLGRNHEPIDPP